MDRPCNRETSAGSLPLAAPRWCYSVPVPSWILALSAGAHRAASLCGLKWSWHVSPPMLYARRWSLSPLAVVLKHLRPQAPLPPHRKPSPQRPRRPRVALRPLKDPRQFPHHRRCQPNRLPRRVPLPGLFSRRLPSLAVHRRLPLAMLASTIHRGRTGASKPRNRAIKLRPLRRQLVAILRKN